MRSLPALLGLAYVLLSTVAAAETRTFVIANSSDGYGVDQCLAGGAPCGQVIANFYCESQAYTRAASFRKVDPADVTGAIAVAADVRAPSSAGPFVAIECAR
jgi:hypothetical protein